MKLATSSLWFLSHYSGGVSTGTTTAAFLVSSASVSGRAAALSLSSSSFYSSSSSARFSSSSSSSLCFNDRHYDAHQQRQQKQQYHRFGKLQRYNNRQQQQQPRTSLLVKSSSFSSSPNNNDGTQTPEEAGMTRDALEILRSSIEAVDPYTAIQKNVRFDPETHVLRIGDEYYDTKEYKKIVLVAFGKASSAMATATLQRLPPEVLAEKMKGGIVIVKDDHETTAERAFLESHSIKIRSASHPVPDQRSVDASKEIMDDWIPNSCQEDKTLLVCCISGGGSALFCCPKKGLTLEDLQTTNRLLLQSGLSIEDMNTIRKACEHGKGGGLARAAHPSTLVSLVLSDVLGDPLDLIASGPTVPDDTGNTHREASRLVSTNPLLRDNLPPNVVQTIREGCRREEEEEEQQKDDDDTPKNTNNHRVRNIIVGNNRAAALAAANRAKRLGYNTILLGTRMIGEARDAATMYIAMAQQLSLQRTNDDDDSYDTRPLPVAMISGGETTVTITPSSSSSGVGGRNQECALAAALYLHRLKLRNVVFASIGTDGGDGPGNDAAGAVVDGGTVDRIGGLSAARDALSRHDSYHYFSRNKQEQEETNTTGKNDRDGEEEEAIGNNNNDDKDATNHDDYSRCLPLIKTGPTGTNVADICVTLIR